MKPGTIKIIKIIVSVLIAALTALGAAIGLNSCNVVRTISNKSEFYQRGDTSVMIQTTTTESYDASKKFYYPQTPQVHGGKEKVKKPNPSPSLKGRDVN